MINKDQPVVVRWEPLPRHNCSYTGLPPGSTEEGGTPAYTGLSLKKGEPLPRHWAVQLQLHRSAPRKKGGGGNPFARATVNTPLLGEGDTTGTRLGLSTTFL